MIMKITIKSSNVKEEFLSKHNHENTCIIIFVLVPRVHSITTFSKVSITDGKCVFIQCFYDSKYIYLYLYKVLVWWILLVICCCLIRNVVHLLRVCSWDQWKVRWHEVLLYMWHQVYHKYISVYFTWTIIVDDFLFYFFFFFYICSE